MDMPYRFYAVHTVTKQIKEFNEQPMNHRFEEWQRIDKITSKKVMLWEFWEDTRYLAKLRLYNYIHKIKPWNPFEGTQIGKSIPILNF